jgi:hypothetical protein
MKSIHCYLTLGICLALYSPSYAQEQSENLEQLVNWMTGEFDSSEQAANDSAFYNISLKISRVWPDKPNGVWLYVEQAMASTLDEPYRQRMYFLSQLGEDEYSSDVYTLPEEAKYIGAWKNPSLLDGLSLFDLKNRSGCAVILFYDGFQYGGATAKGNCESSMNGASFATSEVTILSDQMATWDRGYDAKEEQVWGSIKGPYVFIKK